MDIIESLVCERNKSRYKVATEEYTHSIEYLSQIHICSQQESGSKTFLLSHSVSVVWQICSVVGFFVRKKKCAYMKNEFYCIFSKEIINHFGQDWQITSDIVWPEVFSSTDIFIDAERSFLPIDIVSSETALSKWYNGLNLYSTWCEPEFGGKMSKTNWTYGENTVFCFIN